MFVIGTAGHVDHGKSLLVEALTGIDPDRLAEEKARGMTIDLGFAWLTLPSGRTVSIVDVPGHERFIKNMLAGAGGIDLALLVVAADDGVMPQTREHLAILDLLGVERGVVAVTKSDLVDEDWLELVRQDVANLIASTSLAGSPVVACSSTTRQGLDALSGVLDDTIDALRSKRDVARPRLPIDRVFTIGGFGTVVTGTLVDGELEHGVEVEIVPGNMRARVRGLQSHSESVERAQPGTRTAVNLGGVAREDLRRGLVLALPGMLRATDNLDAQIRTVVPLPHPLRHNMTVTFHCFADEANAQVRLLEAAELRAGEQGWAQLRLDRPVAVLRGDRFVVRTPNDTVAGGVIADTAPRRHRRHDPGVIASLERLLSDDVTDILVEAIRRRPLVTAHALAVDAALSDEEASSTIAALASSGALAVLGEGADARALTKEDLTGLQDRALALLDAYHRAHPLRPGMAQEELRARLKLDAREFSALVASIPGLALSGSTAALRAYTPNLTPAQASAADALVAALHAAPGGSGDVNPELVAHLVATGSVIDTEDGSLFEATVFEGMTTTVREHIDRHGSITLAEARDLLGISRRHAQSLLEHLDRLRVTRRAGDRRVLR